MIIENQNKKLMFVTIGTGKDGKDIAHGIFFSIKNQNPDVVVLIASNESAKITFPHLSELLLSSGKNYQIDKIEINDIDDFEKLHNSYFELIKEYLKKGYKANNVVVDYTSGTKAMSAAIVSAAITAEIGSISYITGERKEGRVLSGTERASSIIPTSIFSSKIINKSIELFNSYQYASAIALIDNTDIHPKFIDLVLVIRTLSNLFNAWDKFDFNQAYSQVSNLSHEQLSKLGLKKQFNRVYIPLLSKLKSESLSLEKINDLVFNASRRAEEAKYDDAVARLYRTIEMIGQLEFEHQFNCSTSDVKYENLPPEVQSYIQQISVQKQIKIGLDNTFKCLDIVKNSTGNLYIKNISTFRKHLGKRNDSILAHGFAPVSENSYKEFFDFTCETFKVGPKSNLNPDFHFPKINYQS